MEISFVNVRYLWLLVIIPFLILTHFYGLKSSKKKALKFSNFEAMERVTGGFMLSLNLPLLLLRFFTLLFLILALSGPILWYTGQGGDFNYVVAIDSSGSMLADDFTPNRLEAAKASAKEFVQNIPTGSKLGVISFSGTTFLKSPLTDDFIEASGSIDDVGIEYSSGTAIGDAIIAASNMFVEDDQGRVIILLTDGQSNVGTVVERAINYANDRFVTVNTIGVGTQEGGSFEGIAAVSTLDDEMLTKIASNTGGRSYLAQNEGELNAIYREIARTSDKKLPLDLAFVLIILTFITLTTEWLIVNTKFRAAP